MSFKIKDIEIKNQVVLAPMAGISNPAYMKIVEEMGCGLAFTELISSEAISRNNQKTFDMLNGIEKLKMPVGVQLFGANPDTLAKSAKILVEKYNIKIIDINMGCPVAKVAVRAKAGSGLLKDIDKIYEIVSKVVNTVNVPVTVKIRSGWDSDNINAVEVAKTIEKAGASLITVHARTRAQGYTGKADWNIIKKVKENVGIPVIGNGDIKNCYDALKMLEETGCDAIMIGRAALGNPWIVKECVNYLENRQEPTKIELKEILDMILKHIKYLKETKNDNIANLEMRTNIAYYLKGIEGAKKLKQDAIKCQNIEELENLIKEYKEVL